MAFTGAKTSFAQIEEKFRRLFNLAGTIGASFAPSITPVVIVANTDGPGYSSFKGRHWAWISEQAGAGAATHVLGMTTPVDVIVTELFCLMPAVGSVTAHVTTPDQATTVSGAGFTRQAGAWVDNRLTATDLCPFTDRTTTTANAAVWALLTQNNRVGAWNGAGTSSPLLSVGQMHIAAGSSLVWDCVAAPVGLRLGAFGRIF